MKSSNLEPLAGFPFCHLHYRSILKENKKQLLYEEVVRIKCHFL